MFIIWADIQRILISILLVIKFDKILILELSKEKTEFFFLFFFFKKNFVYQKSG